MDELQDEDREERDAGKSEVQTGQARVYNAAQHEESWKQALRSNPKSLLWCKYFLLTPLI
jgi:hypothetical protein